MLCGSEERSVLRGSAVVAAAGTDESPALAFFFSFFALFFLCFLFNAGSGSSSVRCLVVDTECAGPLVAESTCASGRCLEPSDSDVGLLRFGGCAGSAALRSTCLEIDA